MIVYQNHLVRQLAQKVKADLREFVMME